MLYQYEVLEDLKEINKELKRLFMATSIFLIIMIIVLVLATINVTKQFKEINASVNKKYAQIESTFNDINTKFYKKEELLK